MFFTVPYCADRRCTENGDHSPARPVDTGFFLRNGSSAHKASLAQPLTLSLIPWATSWWMIFPTIVRVFTGKLWALQTEGKSKAGAYVTKAD